MSGKPMRSVCNGLLDNSRRGSRAVLWCKNTKTQRSPHEPPDHHPE